LQGLEVSDRANITTLQGLEVSDRANITAIQSSYASLTNTNTFTGINNFTVGQTNIDVGSFNEFKYKIVSTSSNSYTIDPTYSFFLLNPSSALTITLPDSSPLTYNSTIYEFRLITSPSITFSCASGASILDLGNSSHSSISYGSNNFFRFLYYNNVYYLLVLN
jgi:hypothetical protein